MRALLCSLLALSIAGTASGAVTRNDDSCDIAQLPAATLLLPYFEVNLDDPDGSTTLFTVANVTHLDQIARVTLWTDRAYPVIAFDIYLTGYDVQSINLYDVIARGIIAPDAGTGTAISQRGEYSDRNTALQLESCDRLPGQLDSHYMERIQRALTDGVVPSIGQIFTGCNGAGDQHADAIGYATIDVVRKCSETLPTDAAYWTDEIGYANALTGDYQHVRRGDRFADGGPMVHIRAVPEGGLTPPLFPRTFYSRFQAPATPKLDARQPLPAVFGARWIYGGTGSYLTSMKVWREGKTGRTAECAQYAQNSAMEAQEIVMFDDAENAVSAIACIPGSNCNQRLLSAASMTPISDVSTFPPIGNGAVSGWVYLNLDHPGDQVASQAWAIASMRAEGQFSVDMDAIALGNGCSAAFADSEIGFGNATIGPLPNVRNPQ